MIDWNAVAALASTAATIIAAVSAYFAWQTLKSQNDPKVIVYTRTDADRPSILVVVIENIGRDIAEDVKFSSSRPIPLGAWGIDKPQKPEANYAQGTAFTNGIPALGPGVSLVYNFGQYAGLKAAIGDEPITVSFQYRRGSRKFSGTGYLEVKSFTHVDVSAGPLLDTANALKKLADEAKNISSSLKGIEGAAVAGLPAGTQDNTQQRNTVGHPSPSDDPPPPVP